MSFWGKEFQNLCLPSSHTLLHLAPSQVPWGQNSTRQPLPIPGNHFLPYKPRLISKIPIPNATFKYYTKLSMRQNFTNATNQFLACILLTAVIVPPIHLITVFFCICSFFIVQILHTINQFSCPTRQYVEQLQATLCPYCSEDWGLHIWQQYSRCGLTRLLYNNQTVSFDLSKNVTSSFTVFCCFKLPAWWNNKCVLDLQESPP